LQDQLRVTAKRHVKGEQRWTEKDRSCRDPDYNRAAEYAGAIMQRIAARDGLGSFGRFRVLASDTDETTTEE
jgi:hypothetical protein